MKPIASFTFKPFLEGKSTGWLSTEHFLACCKASVQAVNDLFGRPTLYVDSIGEHVFKMIGIEADYEVVYDGVHDRVDSGLWAYCKLLTFRAQTQPYMHFDLDFIWTKKPDKSWFDCDIGCQWYEDLSRTPKGYENMWHMGYDLILKQEHYELTPMYMFPYINQIKAICTGVLVMNDMDLNKRWMDEVHEFIEINIESINNPETQIHSCVVEQQSLGLLARDKKVNLLVTNETEQLATPHNDYFTHYMGPVWKKGTDNQFLNELRDLQIGSLIDNDVKQAAIYLTEIQKRNNYG